VRTVAVLFLCQHYSFDFGSATDQTRQQPWQHAGCPASRVAQRSMMNHHTRHLGGFKTRVVDDYWVN
jgi:hypothetical protein